MPPRARALAERHADRLAELWRYYKIGLVNTAFGFGLYTLLVFMGLNLFVAQIASHTCGAVFNYFMFRAHVFKNDTASVFRYILSYAGNYLVGLALLAGFHHVVSSPYIAGFLALLVASLLNYFVLRGLVFKRRPA